MLTPLSQRDRLAHPLSRPEEVAHFINDSAKALCGVKVLKAQRWIIPLLDTAVILLNGVGTTTYPTMLHLRSQHLGARG